MQVDLSDTEVPPGRLRWQFFAERITESVLVEQKRVDVVGLDTLTEEDRAALVSYLNERSVILCRSE